MPIRTEETGARGEVRLRVWNLPLRLFHWGLAASFVTAWLTLDDRYRDIHVFAGYVMAGLLLFRLLWGVIGGPYARFRDFAFGWREARDYLKLVLQRCPPRFLGHNPAGSWAIYLLLGLGLLIAITGLLTLGGEERHGPLAGWLSFAQGEMAHNLHELLAWSMLGLVAVHIAGVVVESLLHRENLVAAMLTGRKPSKPGMVSARAGRPTGILMSVAIAAFGLSWFHGYLVETPERPYRPFSGIELPDQALWREECGACHLAFHPSLLPARSWRTMMAGQSSHFGEDLFLERDSADEIERFLLENAAEQALTEAAWKINRSIAATETPLRITETPYWVDKHKEIPGRVWEDPRVNGKVNCASCHLDADAGTFEDAAMRIPVDTGGALKGLWEAMTSRFRLDSSHAGIFNPKG
ncbi:MAG TPA: cytochrome B [Sedimenticola sp.]|nr:cytochrome B [Sedimenticola sp.]